jgi:hypothetical protein
VAATVLLLWFARASWLRAWPPPIIAGAACCLAVTGPVWDSIRWTAALPHGLLSIAVSFLLLAVGTLTALTKHRWYRHD